MHQSIATIDKPEFINLQPLDINPLMSSCEIKVFYVGKNRNRSCITKDVAIEMSKTLRGAPIVGYYRKEDGDFTDHGDRVIMDDKGIQFECMTVPYGFVAPDAKVWFQKFEEVDEFGNPIIRDYLMTTGYLWTGQFPECKLATQGNGRPHSMELDEDTLDGHWAEDYKTNMEFFIINDAIFSKLCILGENTEPCFEGSTITSPEISSTFSLDEKFKTTLFSMMKELKYALEGGKESMQENEKILDNSNENIIVENEEKIEGTFSNVSDTPVEEKVEEVVEEAPAEPIEEVAEAAETEAATDFEKKEEDKEADSEKPKDEEIQKEEEEPSDEKKDDKYKVKKKCSLEEYEALSKSYEELIAQHNELQEKYSALVEYKNEIEKVEKEKLIDRFYMLSDEDTADVRENINAYSLDEIEQKLSVIYVRKSVDFSLDTKEEENDVKEEAITYALDNNFVSDVPAWISAVQNVKNNRK